MAGHTATKPYVSRNTDGRIESLHRAAPDAEAEQLSAEHPEVRAFVGAGDDSFGRLDTDFVRVIEDVIDTLIERHIINITDLPVEAQAKLFARRSYRERSARNALRLFEGCDNDAIIDSQSG